MYRLPVATGRSHRAAPLALLAKCSQLYLLCPCQPALHRDCFDKKAQHGLMCLFQSYCQCKHRLPFKHTWRVEQKNRRADQKEQKVFFVWYCAHSWRQIHLLGQSRGSALLSCNSTARRDVMFCSKTLQITRNQNKTLLKGRSNLLWQICSFGIRLYVNNLYRTPLIYTYCAKAILHLLWLCFIICTL